MITKAVVLAAGSGTRLLPLSRAMPKEMIRVGTKPTIEHVIELAKAGGLVDILVIVGRKKELIMDHLGSGAFLGVDITYKIQENPKGTAHALTPCKSFVQSDDFGIIYGDNYFKPYSAMNEISNFHSNNGADVTVVLHPVSDPTRFGIVKLDETNNVLQMIEKPSLSEALPFKHDDYWLNIAGVIFCKSSIFNYIENIKPGKNGELWLTDVIELMRRSGLSVKGYIFKGTRYDIGTYESLLEADRLEVLEKDI